MKPVFQKDDDLSGTAARKADDEQHHTKTEKAPERTSISPRIVVEDNSSLANLMDTARFDHMWRIASAISRQSLLPAHLKSKEPEETQANCFRIVNQAVRWGLDPFAVVDEIYVVAGRLGYQGKLVAAVVNARAGLVDRLSYTYNDAAGEELEITVSGQFPGEKEPRTVKLSVKQAKTGNEMWLKDPHQKLIYSGSIRWARAHCPEIILGVVTDDDLDRMNAGELVEGSDGVHRVAAPTRAEHAATVKQAAAEPDTEAAERGASEMDAAYAETMGAAHAAPPPAEEPPATSTESAATAQEPGEACDRVMQLQSQPTKAEMVAWRDGMLDSIAGAPTRDALDALLASHKDGLTYLNDRYATDGQNMRDAIAERRDVLRPAD